MSLPPDSPPAHHDQHSAFIGSESATSSRTPCSSSIPFPASHLSKGVSHIITPPFKELNGQDTHRTSTRSQRSVSLSGGGAVLAELASRVRSDTTSSQDAPVLDTEWLKTQERGELEALLAAADKVIRDSQRGKSRRLRVSRLGQTKWNLCTPL